MTRLLDQVRASLPAFQSVFANAGLRRLELAWACSILGTWAFTIGVVVFAFVFVARALNAFVESLAPMSLDVRLLDGRFALLVADALSLLFRHLSASFGRG